MRGCVPDGGDDAQREGLNEMTYNRCVGTRYCSNNCPYKVRRFNFCTTSTTRDRLQTDAEPGRDCEVARGDGEVHVLRAADQRREDCRFDRQPGLRGDEVVTACQAACPAKAIKFGNLNDPQSAVARPRPARELCVLEELNTRPRTTYLAKLATPTLKSRRANAMNRTDPEPADSAAAVPILGPGHTYASVTDKISASCWCGPTTGGGFWVWGSASC